MPYCPRCGVETDPSVQACPLCTASIPRFPELGPGEPAWPAPGTGDPDLGKRYRTPAQLRTRAFEIVAGVLVIAGAVVTAVNLYVSGTLTWCLYPLSALAAALGAAAALYLCPKRPGRWGLVWALLTMGLLGALDLTAEGRLGWFLPLGLPLTVLSYTLICAAVQYIRKARRRGYNLFALVSFLAALELAAIDFLVSGWTSGVPLLAWSWVTTLVLVPLGLLFTVLHFALRSPPDLGRTFHF